MLRIKDLKDLSFLSVGVTIDMQDLKDLKRFFHANDRGGQAPALRLSRPAPFHRRAARPRRRATHTPALRFARPSPFHRRARACPSPCIDRNGKRPGSACGFRAGRTIAGDRPPRYGPRRGSLRHAPFGSRCSRTTVSSPYNLANRDTLVNPAPNPAPILLHLWRIMSRIRPMSPSSLKLAVPINVSAR